MENRCQDDIFFDVSFDLIYGPGIINNKEMTYTVRSGNKFSQNVPLPISFSKPDIDDMLTVTWSIHKSTDKTLIRQGTANIQIIPKFQYCWNLMRYDEQPVSKNFLLACLTAWSQYGDTNLKEFAQKMIKGIQRRDTPDKSTYEWFKTCYSLFQCTDGIEITPIAAFPPTDCQKISPSVNVWEEKLSNPLEAALFIGALTEKSFAYKRFGMRTVMFIFPQTAASPQQTFCFSWSVDGVNWKAVNMEHANSMTFEDNEKQTTMKLKSLLEKKAEILNALEEKGVYIGDATYAVDFKKAAEKFGIRSLP